jgi:hypothetical protein
MPLIVPLAPLLKYLIVLTRMGGRAVEGTGLENRQGATPRGFESHPIRQIKSQLFPEFA